MRSKLSLAALVVGMFLLVTAVLAQVWASSALLKVPLDTDSTTRLAGTAVVGGEETPVKAYSYTRVDSAKSTDDVVVWETFSCLVKDVGEVDGCVEANDPDDRLITAGSDAFASDRTTGEAVNDPDVAPAGAEQKTGLINKWPFEAEKKSYQYWDSVMGQAVQADYDRTETLQGLDVYVYTVAVDDAPVQLTEDIDGTYTDRKEIWIEPLTGSIVNQTDQQERVDSDGNPFISVDIAFTDEEVTESVDEAKSNVSKLNLVRKTVPIIGYVVGIPLLLVGVALSLLARREEQQPSEDDERTGVSV
ncbi:DUF3068 domain-containing protein [Nocardioides marinquilinus]|uniref:DUF3068 domain-containing protein n=1 Tax=Nocardioides marinquilinus TaxID=1210400 RepID=A0ABP9Q0M2_9ACTN